MKYDSAKFRSVFDIIPVSIVILDENTLISYINKTALSLLNKEYKDVIHKHFGDSFSCIGSYKDERGCGYGQMCIDCKIKKSISMVFEIEQAIDSMEINKQLIIDEKEVNFWFDISMAPIMVSGKTNVVITLSDITDKKKGELKIFEESLNWYQKLGEITDDIILFIDINGNIVDANNEAIKAYGYTYEELCSINIYDISVDKESIKKHMENKNQKENFFEAIHRRKDGSYFNVEVGSRVIITDNNKQILGSMYVVRDITERKMIEEKLKQQEELFRTVFEQSPIGMAFCKSNGEIIEVNSMCEKIFERSAYELKLLGWRNITHPEDIIKDADKFAKFKSGVENTFSTIKRYLKPDGSVSWVNLTLVPLQIENSTEQINLAMLEDITERIQVEEKLLEDEKLKSVLLSNLSGIIYRSNYDKERTMQFITDGCYNLTGYRPESLLGNNKLSFNDLIDKEYRDYLRSKWSQAVTERSILKEEYSIITASGDSKWVYEQGNGVYDENGKVVALEGLIIDITDRKRKEDEINYLNYHDVLTGLYNRRFFEKEMLLLNNENKLPISIIMVDINGLKIINDTLGHSQGDGLVIKIANILKVYVGELGIVARTGGGNFSILLPKTDNIEANRLMKLIETDCNESNGMIKSVICRTSISLGCATKVSVYEPFDNLIKNAEDSMYRDKLLQSKSMHSSVLSTMKTTLLEKSQETEEHALRLIHLSKAIGQKMALTDGQLNELELLSTLHDIGKIGVSDIIINKPGRLTEEERIQMKKHPEIGYRIAITSKELLPIAEYILCHHERYDGKGYPQGIKGDEIPLLSRIVAVVDSYDAMTEDRPYQKAKTKEAAIDEIRRNAGTQFDPEIAKIFIDIINKNQQ